MPNAREECHDVKIGKEKKKNLYRKKNEFFIRLSYKLFLFYVKDTADPILSVLIPFSVM